MAYNLRSKRIRDELLEAEENTVSFGGNASESEDDHVSEQSASEYEVSGSESEMDEDLENSSLAQRLLQSRARGRPISTLRGKNGYVWKVDAPMRQSGMKRIINSDKISELALCPLFCEQFHQNDVFSAIIPIYRYYFVLLFLLSFNKFIL